MTEIQRVALTLIVAGIAMIATIAVDAQYRARRKAAHRKRLREIRLWRCGFARAMSDAEEYFSEVEAKAFEQHKKGETIFHSKDCAEFCGGKYVEKGEAICVE